MKQFLYMLLFVPVLVRGQGLVQGTVRSAAGPLSGASIRVVGEALGTESDVAGKFSLLVPAAGSLQVSHVGYRSRVVKASFKELVVILQAAGDTLQEVVFNTGYQNLSQERSTGSFTQVGPKQLNRRVSTDILGRLSDAVPGLIFNRVGNGAAGNNSISIRGTGTIKANPEPLIVVDNFPYDQDISNINPNDVESITVLKDAAAASIWGARAGNGVIVITTKKGRYFQPVTVSLNSNITFGAKPNQFYLPGMSAADYIGIEQKLFAAGFYNATETSVAKGPLTPVVELLIAKRDGKLSDADARIAALKGLNVRNDYDRYFNRVSVNLQNSLSVSGGSSNQKYVIGAGYDRNLQNLVGNDYNRVTVSAVNTYNFLDKKLELTTGLYYTEGRTRVNNPGTTQLGLSGTSGALYPYAQLAGADGQPLAVVRAYRQSFLDGAVKQGLLDWNFRPLDEIALADNVAKARDYRLRAALTYRVLPQLTAEVLYQYGRTANSIRTLYGADTYYTRDQINNLTAVNPDGSLVRPVPLGGILDLTSGEVATQNFRGQLNYTKIWNADHDLYAIAGYELRSNRNLSDAYRLYGYDAEHATSVAVNYAATFPRYVSSTLSRPSILNRDKETDLVDNFLSYYANAGYTYRNRYQLTASARLDQSNLFGVNTNQKGVPLYSVGLGWKISDEAFYQLNWLPVLRLRATYGYNGNISKDLSAYTTALYNSGTGTVTRLPFATVQNPPNPALRWERVNIRNLALDFGLKNNRLGGSVEYYQKQGTDLIGTTPFPPSSGISTFTGNSANTAGHGFDVQLNSRNLTGALGWQTSFFISFVSDKVTKYTSSATLSGSSFVDGGYNPNEGRPLYSIYSYAWAGLDPQNGDPQGYLNGVVSKNYLSIRNTATRESIVYNGPARPTTFGALLNTLSWRSVSLLANISYRLGYYFRRRSIAYANDQGLGSQNGDYARRWQKPGDELVTQVPSVPLATNNNRDYFYTWSSALVEKADNIRLQDINVSYVINKHLQVYSYVNNVCIFWKATKTGLDPDYNQIIPPSRTIAFGLKANF
jgi:TonB-linked SusC/RagA family outer membrane protein